MKTIERYKLFVDEYLTNGLNGTKAYLKVYDCDINTAKVNASKILTKANVKELIAEKQIEINERANISKEIILNKLIEIAYDENSKKQDVINAIVNINKMMGYNAPTESNINMNLEQPLFGDDE